MFLHPCPPRPAEPSSHPVPRNFQEKSAPTSLHAVCCRAQHGALKPAGLGAHLQSPTHFLDLCREAGYIIFLNLIFLSGQMRQ